MDGYPDDNLRPFQRVKRLFGIREVREAVELGGITGRLKHPMGHHTCKLLEDFMERLYRYARLAAPELLEEKKVYGIQHILMRPLYAFINMYVLRSGFVERYYRFMIPVLYAFYPFLKYIKLREL